MGWMLLIQLLEARCDQSELLAELLPLAELLLGLLQGLGAPLPQTFVELGLELGAFRGQRSDASALSGIHLHDHPLTDLQPEWPGTLQCLSLRQRDTIQHHLLVSRFQVNRRRHAFESDLQFSKPFLPTLQGRQSLGGLARTSSKLVLE